MIIFIHFICRWEIFLFTVLVFCAKIWVFLGKTGDVKMRKMTFALLSIQNSQSHFLMYFWGKRKREKESELQDVIEIANDEMSMFFLINRIQLDSFYLRRLCKMNEWIKSLAKVYSELFNASWIFNIENWGRVIQNLNFFPVNI